MSTRGERSRWTLLWAATTLLAALCATGLDAFLLQRRVNYFTGGFLSTDHLKSVPQTLGFLAASLASDVAVLGVVVALVLWASARLGVGWLVACGLAATVAGGAVAAADVVAYQILQYLGEGFDLALLFRLAGNSPGEFFAVSAEHAYRIGAVVVAGLCLAGLLVAGLIRSSRRAGGALLPRIGLGSALAWPALVLVVASIACVAVRTSSDVLDNGLKRKPTGRVMTIAAWYLTDVDRDGFGVLGQLRDPDPFDAAITPYAVDIPGNGIDEDGVAGDLPAAVAAYVEPSGVAPRWRSRKDVVLVVLESVRADVVDEVVDGTPVTPVLSELAARGVRSRAAYSHNGYTVQSRHHIFSGSLADVRGPATLIDDFKANGYETAYFSAQDESFGGPEWSVGFDRADVSFDGRDALDRRYSTFATPGSLSIPFGVVTERVSAFFHERQAEKPLFLVVNFHDSHFPYHHAGIAPLVSSTVVPQADIAPQRARELRAMYMNTMANIDRAIGEVLESFRATSGREPAVIVLSDHGESLYDDGFLGHGFALNDVQTQIPFVAAGLPFVISEPFAQADLRDVLWAALDADEESATPRVVRPEGRQVFQYLGTVDAPVQIALAGLGSRTVYDFRTRRVSVAPGVWQRPDELDRTAISEFTTLIQTWERMRLAQKAGSR